MHCSSRYVLYLAVTGITASRISKETIMIIRYLSSAPIGIAVIAAAYRFRYKPRVMDGVALSTRGLVNRFVFKIENRAENM